MYTQLFVFGAAFLGSAVEATEALTIVLAVGLTRGWRAPLLGAAAALALLALLVIVFGQLIVTRVPESGLKLIVGTLLLLFGLRWLHKAVLRSAGVVALHDEERAPLWLVGERVHRFLDPLPGKAPYELLQVFAEAASDGAKVSGIQVGRTRDLTSPVDLVRRNFPYLR